MGTVTVDLLQRWLVSRALLGRDCHNKQFPEKRNSTFTCSQKLSKAGVFNRQWPRDHHTDWDATTTSVRVSEGIHCFFLTFACQMFGLKLPSATHVRCRPACGKNWGKRVGNQGREISQKGTSNTTWGLSPQGTEGQKSTDWSYEDKGLWLVKVRKW